MGASGIELDAVGDFSPTALGETGRREVKNLFRSHGLEVAAVHAPLRRGLDEVEAQEARIDAVRATMTLAFDLGCRIAVVPCGPIPTGDDARTAPFRDALGALARHGDRVGTALALAATFDPADAVLAALAGTDSGTLGVCAQPADLFANGQDPYAFVRKVHGLLRYVRAADAQRVGVGRAARRVPPGQGDLDWIALVAAFEEIGYCGWLTVDVEPGASAPAENAAGVAFLSRLNA